MGKSCTTPAKCDGDDDCDDDDNSKSCEDDLDHLIGIGFNTNLDGQDHVNKETVELDITQRARHPTSGSAQSLMGPSKPDQAK